ncbi:acyl carrier protein [Hymenobacter monticola]|uniref:Acyl carrier protein n=1 Tax=Hymenobacter monticola TaxID=1705399 RepID=A0ABY4BDN6_9BACT|nr:acyl carrier protein [Hymenobacter monticola]UOE36422.1 acyl carrier protein [Hymenobacter monticola]
MVAHPIRPADTQAALARQVRHIIHARKGIRLRRLRLNTDLSQELGFDTVDLVDIILELERCFQLGIPDEVPLHTVGDCVRYIGSHLPAHHPEMAA